MLTGATVSVITGCGQETPPEGSAVKNRELIPVMVSHGVSKMISDSGITRYKIITEEWEVYDQAKPPRQDFKKGILILRFDEKMNIDMQITADTAYWYDQNLWELHGRVRMNNEAKELNFRSEQLYWDMNLHEFYSNVWMEVITPDRQIEGTRFRANEQMTKYEVFDAKGRIPMPKNEKDSKPAGGQKDSVINETPQKEDANPTKKDDETTKKGKK